MRFEELKFEQGGCCGAHRGAIVKTPTGSIAIREVEDMFNVTEYDLDDCPVSRELHQTREQVEQRIAEL